MTRRNHVSRCFSTCRLASVLALVGLIVLSSPLLAQVDKSSSSPSATPKWSTPKATTAPSEKAVKSGAKLAPGEKVNINTASKEKLGALPGIGPAKAQAIMDGRPYAKPDDIMKVKGIKKGTYDKLKDLITVY